MIIIDQFLAFKSKCATDQKKYKTVSHHANIEDCLCIDEVMGLVIVNVSLSYPDINHTLRHVVDSSKHYLLS